MIHPWEVDFSNPLQPVVRVGAVQVLPTRLTVDARPGVAPTLYLELPPGERLEGDGFVVQNVMEGGGIIEFLESVDVERLKSESMKRSDWGGDAYQDTIAVLIDMAKEQA